jgi:hypothetical protein
MTLLLEPEVEAAPTVRMNATTNKVRVVDLAYEGDLLHLLSRLDFFRRGAEKARKNLQWREALSFARQIGRRLVEMIDKYIPTNLDSDELRAAHVAKREFETLLYGIAQQLPPRSRWHRWGLMKEQLIVGEATQTKIRTCLQKLGELLKSSFAVFINRYPSSSSARGWVEAAAIFLVEYNKMVRDWND